MLDLQNAARAKGLEAVGMKISVDELVTVKVPAVLHLWGDHFVVLEARDADSFTLTDPPAEPVVVKKEDVKESYSGFALLVARDANLFPDPKAEGPDLRVDAYTWDFGTVNEGDQADHVFKCRNVGNADLVISKVETSCGDCLIPLSGSQTIPPGGTGEIKAVVNTASQRREVAKELYVSSNDPISPVVHIAVTGYVRPAQLLFSPQSVNFGSLRRTETGKTEVYVPSYEEDKLEVTSVSSSSPLVTAELSPSTQKDRPGYIITAALKARAPLGELKAKITIVSNHWKQPKFEIPVTATIRGNIDLDRESFFLGIVKKGSPSHSEHSEESRPRFFAVLRMTSVAKDPLKIEKVESSLSCVSVDVAPKTEGKDYTLTATLKPDAPRGNIKGEVTIHTNDPDQPQVKVPIYAYVEE